MADATRSLKIVVEEERKGRGFTEVARDMDGVSRSVDTNDERLKQWAKDSAILRTEIEKSTVRVKELRTEVAKTGDTSLFGDIRREESRLKNFERTLAALAPEFTKAGSVASSSFLEGFKDLPVKQVLIPALIAGAVAAAPAVGAAVAGAVTGVVGGLGIAGGIFAASRDPKVKAAASAAGKEISAQFFGAGTSFVNPTIDALNILSRRAGELNLSSSFAKAAPYVTEVADGIGKLGVNFMPGFNRALDDAAPVMDELGRALPRIGTDLGNMLDSIASSRGTVDGLKATFGLLEGAIVGTGNAVHYLGDAFETELDVMRGVGMEVDKVRDAIGIGGLKGVITQTGDGLGSFAAGMASVITPTTLAAAATRAMTVELQALDAKTRDYLGLQDSLEQAQISSAMAMTAFANNVAKGTANWTLNTAKGQENLELQHQAIAAAEATRAAEIDAAHGSAAAIQAANVEFNKAIDTILGIGAAAGESKKQVDALAGTRKITIDVSSNINSVVSSINRALSAFSGGGGGSQSFGKVPGFAAGGNPPPGMAWAGEHGPELIDFTGKERVYNHQDSMAMTRAGGGGTGVQTLRVEVGGTPSGPLESMFVDWIMEKLRLKILAGYSLP